LHAGYDFRVPGSAPPVVHGLQIDQALGFQRRFECVQRVAWWLLYALAFLGDDRDRPLRSDIACFI
jgi:hypothetical protein